jgi:hypothetical protein
VREDNSREFGVGKTKNQNKKKKTSNEKSIELGLVP